MKPMNITGREPTIVWCTKKQSTLTATATATLTTKTTTVLLETLMLVKRFQRIDSYKQTAPSRS
jgi:hypothetical protein